MYLKTNTSLPLSQALKLMFALSIMADNISHSHEIRSLSRNVALADKCCYACRGPLYDILIGQLNEITQKLEHMEKRYVTYKANTSTIHIRITARTAITAFIKT